MATVFMFVVWFWLLILIFGDLFRRHDISGWLRVVWALIVILTSYIGVFVYLITQGRGMAERNAQQAQAAREELRRAVGLSVPDEIAKLDQLKKAGSITDDEFAQIRASSFSDGAFCRSRLFGHGFCAMNAVSSHRQLVQRCDLPSSS